MKERLVDIITNVTTPMVMNDVQIGEYRTPRWMAELLADALVEKGVMLAEVEEG